MRCSIIIFLLVLASCQVVEEDAVLSQEGMMVQYDDTQWPTNSTVFSSAFGPRLKASENFRYDFHRGIDIPGNVGDPVGSIADGVVDAVYYEGEEDNPYPNGGTVVVVKHTMDTPFLFHDLAYTEYYSLYMHLDSVAVEEGKNLSRGEGLGVIGHTGPTTFDHLHFEIRIGSRCSREYQKQHPDAHCSKVFPEPTDPHVNPLLFLPYDDEGSLAYTVDSLSPLTITITSNRDELDFNEIVVMYQGVEKRINFNDRLGIDPENIDNPGYDGVVISAAMFNSTSKHYEITFTFSDFEGYDSIDIRDIWGNAARLL